MNAMDSPFLPSARTDDDVLPLFMFLFYPIQMTVVETHDVAEMDG